MSTKQLYEKTSEGMKEVSPLVAIEDIYSRLSDTPLEALVSLYNHVKCEWKGSVAETRKTVPMFLRRSGLFITYNNGTKYITEFFSAGTDQINTENWVKDSNWTPIPDEDYISAGVKPGVGTIGYEQLSDNLKQLFREKVSVTNFPDDEDIASVDNMLKFKDREVNAANFQSKGYVILRKNLRLVNGVVKNILTQNMINQPNTIYEIRYDFDLNNEHIIFPENSIIKFNGGSLTNGIADFSNILNNKIYSCWFKSIQDINYAIDYLSNKILIIDTLPILDIPITNSKPVYNLTISGYNRRTPTIVKYETTAFHIKGAGNVIKNLSFKPLNINKKDINTLILESSKSDDSDLDDEVIKCNFYHVEGNSHVTSYGRGITLRDNIFEGTGINNSIINCYLRDNHSTGNDYNQNARYNGRAIRIECNRIHSAYGSYFVSLKHNENSPDCVFNGVTIKDNYSDLNCLLLKTENRNIDTLISGNTFLYLTRSPFLVLSYFENMVITNNCFTVREKEDTFPGGNTGAILINLLNSSITQGLSIMGNILFSNSTFINIDNASEDKTISNIMVSNNSFTRNSFETQSVLRGIIGGKKCNLEHINITNNMLVGNDTKCFAFVISDSTILQSSGIKYSDIVLSNNINIKNLIYTNLTNLNSKIQLENLNIGLPSYKEYEDDTQHLYLNVLNTPMIDPVTKRIISSTDGSNYGVLRDGSGRRRTMPMSSEGINGVVANQSDIGYYIFRTTDNKAIFYNGANWVDALGNNSESLSKGTTEQRPKNAQIGYIYKDTTINKLIVWDGIAWTNLDGTALNINNTGTTQERPTNVDIGFIYKDTTLNKLILWEGTKWVNLDGTALA